MLCVLTFQLKPCLLTSCDLPLKSKTFSFPVSASSLPTTWYLLTAVPCRPVTDTAAGLSAANSYLEETGTWLLSFACTSPVLSHEGNLFGHRRESLSVSFSRNHFVGMGFLVCMHQILTLRGHTAILEVQPGYSNLMGKVYHKRLLTK